MNLKDCVVFSDSLVLPQQVKVVLLPLVEVGTAPLILTGNDILRSINSFLNAMYTQIIAVVPLRSRVDLWL